MIYLTIFGTALLAATIVPFSSELAVGAAIVAGLPAVAVWSAATAGNTAGALLNALLGRILSGRSARRTLGISDESYAKSMAWFNRYGVYSLLLSWLPVVGDGLTVIAGALRVPWTLFTLLVFVGKGARYAVIIALADLAVETVP